MTCTAKVIAASANGAAPTGMVSFVSGDKTLAMIPLKKDGMASLAMPSQPSVHGILAVYGGDRTFRAGASKLFNLTSEGAVEQATARQSSTVNNDNTTTKRPGEVIIYRPGEPAPTDNEANTLNRNQAIRGFGEDGE